MKAYHFVGDTLRDGRPVPPDGEWLEHGGEIEMCASGLHASLRPWDALQYAPGPVLCEVEVDGDISHDTDKLVARRRRIIRRVDLTPTLRAFARDEAARVLYLWDAPEVVRQYLTTGDESLRAAASAAAWYAAGVAVLDAASAAAWAAASAAAWDAASAAARAAAGVAAMDAAWDAAWAAARAAAWEAASEAAGDAGGQRFDAAAIAALEGGE